VASSILFTARPGEPVGATGLSVDASEYRARLAEQSDAQIDSWAAEMMRDVAIRRGVAREGRLMVPAVALWALVPGIRSQVSDGRERLIEYLVANFHELVYV
jgi:hypothetical protein